MIKGKHLIGFLLLVLAIYACTEDNDKYDRPEWLAGKLYTQIASQENLSTFAKCIELSGFDKLINVSGSYTVFAPTNEAFDLFFSNHPQYNKVEDIPAEVLTDMVKYHILQNPWSRKQLRSLDINGWIDTTTIYNNKPRGYKRETLMLKPDSRYGVREIENEELIIIDTLQTSWVRRVATDSRKYAPIFYQEYFNIYNLPLSDYGFYFDRQFEGANDMYFVNAKMIGQEIFAENGFIHIIDRVVTPLRNANEILRSKDANSQYSEFLNLLNRFADLNYNETKTFAQPGAAQGLVVDSLFDLTFPRLAFDFTSESTKPAYISGGLPSYISIRFHHGMVAPTNQAFQEFVAQYIQGGNQWRSLANMPEKIKRIIANSYLSASPIYGSDIQKGFVNGEDDNIRINESDIIQKEYTSNSTFIGVSKAIVPRAFSSVTGPVYRQPGYSTVMNAIEYSGLLASLKREGQDYVLFTVHDQTLQQDSSLLYNYSKRNNIVTEFFNAYTIAPAMPVQTRFTKLDIRTLLLNHITVERPKGIARKEFLPTLAGNHIIWDNETGVVRGSAASTRGYSGSELLDVVPVKISTDTDNGDTYEIQTWFGFTANGLYTYINSNFPEFQKLLIDAGLAVTKEFTYSFISPNQFYTVFAPTKEALEAANASSLRGNELRRFLMLHFVQGKLIFTDGKVMSGYYETASIIPATGGEPARNARIYIEPATDIIRIGAKGGGIHVTVAEAPGTNIITARTIGTEQGAFANTLTNGVIHPVTTAFTLDGVDIR